MYFIEYGIKLENKVLLINPLSDTIQLFCLEIYKRVVIYKIWNYVEWAIYISYSKWVD